MSFPSVQTSDSVTESFCSYFFSLNRLPCWGLTISWLAGWRVWKCADPWVRETLATLPTYRLTLAATFLSSLRPHPHPPTLSLQNPANIPPNPIDCGVRWLCAQSFPWDQANCCGNVYKHFCVLGKVWFDGYVSNHFYF